MVAGALVLTVAMSLGGVSQAAASLIFDFSEIAGDVQLTVSGTVNLDATLGSWGITTNTYQGIEPLEGLALAGNGVPGGLYSVSSEWTPFGGGGYASFSTSSGDRVVLGQYQYLALPLDYVSGTPLVNGEFTDSVVVNVGSTVLEPTTLFLLGAGLLGVAARRRGRRS